MNELFGAKQIDQALTAAENQPVERLARMLWEADAIKGSWDAPFWQDIKALKRTEAEFLLAHADVLADILRQSRETK